MAWIDWQGLAKMIIGVAIGYWLRGASPASERE